jgi:hypothetical protein
MRILVSMLFGLLIAGSCVVSGQNVDRELNIAAGQTLEIVNRFGRVDVVAQEALRPRPKGRSPQTFPRRFRSFLRKSSAKNEIKTIGLEREYADRSAAGFAFETR